jgi:hypothetical protein
MSLDPVVGLLIAAAFTLLFASAAVHKLRARRRFDELFAAYELLPPASRRFAARTLPLLELAVAFGLLAAPCRRYAGCAGALLLLGYAAAIGANLHRGRRTLACGCGGPDEGRPIAPWMVGRNLLLACCLACGTLWPWTARTLRLTDGMTLAFGVGCSVVIYLCAGQLAQLGRRTRHLQPADSRYPSESR